MLGIAQPDGRVEFSRDGFTYVLRLAPSRMSLRCGFRVAGILAPVMQVVARAKSQHGIFTLAMAHFFQNPASEDNTVYLVDAFAPYTEVIQENVTPPVSFTLASKVDDHFAGRQNALMDWLGRAMEQNLSSFLPGCLAQQARLESALEALGVTKKSSESPLPAEKSG